MATLVANNTETTISRIPLRHGINTVGRAEGNHQVIPHSSVSSRHCEIVVGEAGVSVRDLGSTNGTFIDDQQVQHAALPHGHRLRLGNVEFVLDAPETVNVPKAGQLRVFAAAVSAVPPVEAPVGRTAAQTIAALAPTLEDEPSFYHQIPGAFVYPFKKSGIWLLIIGTVVFTGLELLSAVAGILGLVISVILAGYLFAYMQKIIAHSAQGDDEMPDFPDFGEWWSDIFLPFLLFVGAIVVCMLPTIAVTFLMAGNESMIWTLIPAAAIGIFYFPMALLAVAVTDNFLALSPHVVLPSIVRVFVPYLVTFLLLALLFTVRVGGGLAAELVPAEWLPLKIMVTLVMGFVSLYLLTVEMRLLGLLFRSYRPQLGWL
jgi:hypothetical protein